jgi:FkbM family methyltransferase
MIVSNCSVRKPIEFGEIPFAMRLMLHAYYPKFHPVNEDSLSWLVGHFLDAANSRNWDDLISGSIAVQFASEVRRAKINATNSQYVALDTTNTEFTQGYEPEIGCLLDRLVPHRGLFCDIGANWGYFSLFLASRPGFNGEIHAFEPIPGSFNDLQSLMTEMGLNAIVRCHNIALSNVDGNAKMTIPNHSSGMATLSENDGGIAVRLSTLDSLTFSRIDFLKIDVEGHESQVIEGAQKTISTHLPYIVYEDWYDSTAIQAAGQRHISKLLEAHGYRSFFLGWQRHDGSIASSLVGDADTQKLALRPFDYAAARSTLPRRINILACHSSKTNDMATLLTSVVKKEP